VSRWPLLLAALWTTAAQAQVDVGEVRVTLARPIRTFVLLQRIEVPDPAPASLPETSRAAHARWLDARRAYAALVARLRAAPREDRAARSRELDEADRAVLAASEPLRRSLDGALEGLAREALLLLGALEHDRAARAFETALASYDACVEAGRSDCVDPSIDDGRALGVWARIEGTDAVAAHARYQRAVSLEESANHEAAIPLLESALASEGIPAALEAAAAARLGTLTHPASADAVARTFGRCAERAIPDVSPACALLAAEALRAIGRDADALSAVLPLLDDPEGRGEDARRLAAEVVSRDAEAAGRIATPGTRARVLDSAATMLADLGSLGRAVELLRGAEALAPDAARARRIGELDSLRASRADEPAAWLERAVRLCAGGRFPLEGRLSVRGRFERGALRVRVTSDPERGLRPVAACLRTAPRPESPLTGSFTAVIAIESGTE
jgi:hypothetical protein